MCSLKSMGKNLQNELWARPLASKLSERQPPTLFLGVDTENGKNGFFSHFYNAKVFKGYPGMQLESWRPVRSENVMLFYAISFWTGVMATQSQQSLKF